MNKVAIYCRLSDEDRNKNNSLDDSESIQNQKNMLTKYAIEQEWDIFKIYSDDDWSGLDSDRPEWNQMIKDAATKKFNIILCKTQARFTRDMEAVEKYLHNKFIEWDIRFIGYADNADTANKGNKKSRQINGLVNEWYCEDISDNIRASFKVKCQDGQFIGSFASYGYKKEPANKNKLCIDEEAAQVVETIFEWYLEGYGTQHIAFMLNEKCIPNPTKYKQNAGLNFKNSNAKDDLGLWNKTTVKRILKNEMYIGNMVQGKRRKVSYKSKKIISTDKNQWFTAENTHEPIIDKGMFEETQSRIDKRQRSTGTGKAHIFSTKVRCLDCGSTMNKVTTFRGNQKLYSYLRCKTYAATGNKTLCTSHSIRLDLLQGEVTKRLKQHINNYLNDGDIAKEMEAEILINDNIKVFKNELGNIEKQLNQSSYVFKNLYVDKINGVITDEQFVELNLSFKKEKESLYKRKEDIGKRINDLNENVGDINKWIDIIKMYKDFKELTHTIVDKFINYIEIGEKDKKTGEQKVIIHWLF